MKTATSLTFGIASSIGLCIALLSLTQAVMAEPEQHRLETASSTNLWTSTPVRIDVAKQNYDRIPALYSSYVTDAPKVSVAAVVPAPNSKSGPEKLTLSAEHLTWCSSRYRSYNKTTNTYQAFSGETKACMSPFQTPQRVSGEVAEAGGDVTVNSSVTTWCAARYKSYRTSDNTYQPYQGVRRVCIPPAGQEIASVR